MLLTLTGPDSSGSYSTNAANKMSSRIWNEIATTANFIIIFLLQNTKQSIAQVSIDVFTRALDMEHNPFM